jgi:hypothetical protein
VQCGRRSTVTVCTSPLCSMIKPHTDTLKRYDRGSKVFIVEISCMIPTSKRKRASPHCTTVVHEIVRQIREVRYKTMRIPAVKHIATHEGISTPPLRANAASLFCGKHVASGRRQTTTYLYLPHFSSSIFYIQLLICLPLRNRIQN